MTDWSVKTVYIRWLLLDKFVARVALSLFGMRKTGRERGCSLASSVRQRQKKYERKLLLLVFLETTARLRVGRHETSVAWHGRAEYPDR